MTEQTTLPQEQDKIMDIDQLSPSRAREELMGYAIDDLTIDANALKPEEGHIRGKAFTEGEATSLARDAVEIAKLLKEGDESRMDIYEEVEAKIEEMAEARGTNSFWMKDRFLNVVTDLSNEEELIDKVNQEPQDSIDSQISDIGLKDELAEKFTDIVSQAASAHESDQGDDLEKISEKYSELSRKSIEDGDIDEDQAIAIEAVYQKAIGNEVDEDEPDVEADDSDRDKVMEHLESRGVSEKIANFFSGKIIKIRDSFNRDTDGEYDEDALRKSIKEYIKAVIDVLDPPFDDIDQLATPEEIREINAMLAETVGEYNVRIVNELAGEIKDEIASQDQQDDSEPANSDLGYGTVVDQNTESNNEDNNEEEEQETKKLSRWQRLKLRVNNFIMTKDIREFFSDQENDPKVALAVGVVATAGIFTYLQARSGSVDLSDVQNQLNEILTELNNNDTVEAVREGVEEVISDAAEALDSSDAATDNPAPESGFGQDEVDALNELFGSGEGGASGAEATTATPEEYGLDLNNDYPWDVAHELDPGNENQALQGAMDQLSQELGVEVNLTGSGTNQMVQVGDHIINPEEMRMMNDIMFRTLTGS